MAKPKSLKSARVELSQIRNDADHRVQQSMEKVFSEFVGATDRDLRRALQHACQPIRAQEDAAISQMIAELDPTDRKQLFSETLDPHLLETWQR